MMLTSIDVTLATQYDDKVPCFLYTPFYRIETASLDELEIESLDLVDIIVLIEKEFGFKVEPAEIVKVITVGELYDFIAQRVNKPEHV